MRAAKSYNGNLMEKGHQNEEVVLNWLKTVGKEVIDFRDFRLAQRIDVDFGIETIDGNIVLLEIKSDKHIKENGNLLFECNRINHFVKDKWFYLGWGWRSPAQKLLIRNPNTSESFLFNFGELRKWIGEYIHEVGSKLRTAIIETDKQKTTFCYLIPMPKIKHIYKKVIIGI